MDKSNYQPGASMPQIGAIQYPQGLAAPQPPQQQQAYSTFQPTFQQQQPAYTPFQPQPSYQPGTQPSFVSPHNSYISTMAANTASGVSEKPGFVNMEPPKHEFKDVFDDQMRSKLQADFDEISKMTLIDNEDSLYTLLANKSAFSTKNVCVALLSEYYKEKYSELFRKYDSLSVYLEFVVSMIVYCNESNLKKASASRVVRIPSSNPGSFSSTFKIRKRGATIESVGGSIPKKSTKAQHPFLLSDEYLARPTLYNIGKCCEYIIPSEFAELYTNVQYETVTRLANSVDKDICKGLKIVLSKPVVCLLVTKLVQGFTFISLEHLSTLGSILSNMTNLGKLDDSFAFGVRKGMKIDHLPVISDDNPPAFTTGFHMVVVNTMQVCAKSNNTFASRTYANQVYNPPSSEVTDKEMEFAEKAMANEAKIVEKQMEEYDEMVATLNSADPAKADQPEQPIVVSEPIIDAAKILSSNI